MSGVTQRAASDAVWEALTEEEREERRRASQQAREARVAAEQAAKEAKQQTAPTSTKKPNWNKYQVGALVGRFLKDKQSEVNLGKITPTRLSDLRSRLKHFCEYFKTRRMTSLDERDIIKFQEVQSKRVSSGLISIASLGQDYKAVRQATPYKQWKQLNNTCKKQKHCKTKTPRTSSMEQRHIIVRSTRRKRTTHTKGDKQS